MSAHSSIQSSEEELLFLKLLKDLPAGESMAEDRLCDELSLGEPALFDLAVSLLSKGEPICFSSCVGWHDSAFHGADWQTETYWYASDPKGLESTRDGVESWKKTFEQLLSDIDAAKGRLSGRAA